MLSFLAKWLVKWLVLDLALLSDLLNLRSDGNFQRWGFESARSQYPHCNETCGYSNPQSSHFAAKPANRVALSCEHVNQPLSTSSYRDSKTARFRSSHSDSIVIRGE